MPSAHKAEVKKLVSMGTVLQPLDNIQPRQQGDDAVIAADHGYSKHTGVADNGVDHKDCPLVRNGHSSQVLSRKAFMLCYHLTWCDFDHTPLGVIFP